MGRVQDYGNSDYCFDDQYSMRPEERKEPAALSVSDAMNRAKHALEGVTVRLVGEVSELSNKPGYKAVYFSVKDQQASLPCMMWVNRYKASGVDMRIGQLVELSGRFTLYAAKGRMNFDVFSIRLAGEGDLRMKVAQLAKKLESEGLTDACRKRSLPDYPQVVGLVTSPRGAAVHDVLRTLRRRYPMARVLLAGVPVEGPSAAEGMCKGLAAVCSAGAEVVMLVRGGGSFEDLMPFNDERLARTIAACPVPVVTGIGHEPDTSIADLVADRRASTPTAAAEAIAPSVEQMSQDLAARSERLSSGLGRRLERSRLFLQRYADRPLMKDPAYLFASEAQSLDSLSYRLERAIPNVLSKDANHMAVQKAKLYSVGKSLVAHYGNRMALSAARLEDLSPLAILSRGYSIARMEDGSVMKSVIQANAGTPFTLSLGDGQVRATVDSVIVE